jgi:hypothetical protein
MGTNRRRGLVQHLGAEVWGEGRVPLGPVVLVAGALEPGIPASALTALRPACRLEDGPAGSPLLNPKPIQHPRQRPYPPRT